MTQSMQKKSQKSFNRFLYEFDFEDYSKFLFEDNNFYSAINLCYKNIMNGNFSIYEVYDLSEDFLNTLKQYKRFHDAFLKNQMAGCGIKRYNLIETLEYRIIIHKLFGKEKNISSENIDKAFMEIIDCLNSLKRDFIKYVDGDIYDNKKDAIYSEIKKNNKKLRAVCYFKEKRVLK